MDHFYGKVENVITHCSNDSKQLFISGTSDREFRKWQLKNRELPVKSLTSADVQITWAVIDPDLVASIRGNSYLDTY